MYYMETRILVVYYIISLGAIWYASTYNLLVLLIATLIICVIGRRKTWQHVNDVRIIYTLIFTIVVDGMSPIWPILYILITTIGLSILSEDYWYDKEAGNVR